MDFLDRAKLLGHDIACLKSGEVISSTVVINSIDDYRLLFGGETSEAARVDFSDALNALSEPITIKEIPRAALTRLTDYVYGNGTLSANDKALAESIFPIKINAVSAENIVISTDLTYGPSASPYMLNAGTLTFSGGAISLLNTVANITADRLVVKVGGTKAYHVGILGSIGTTGATGAAGSSYSGPAANGKDKSAASPGICTGVGSGGDGDNGGDGGNGQPGGQGGNGLPSLSATISIKAFDSSSTSIFSVFTQSGTGGKGGTGGAGGMGQDGGRGGNGCDSGCEGTDGGRGGRGGKGGNGGPGGVGGNGAAGMPITVNFPGASRQSLVTNAQPAPAGQGGTGGMAGAGGKGGAGGSGGKHSVNGSAGSPGISGSAGPSGTPGVLAGAPGQFIINYS
ncbi:hypothetical protein [Burkholderia sp. TSV86]|uniref:hypothetical protein n=1 Tax=Burkholderia sp. TSV86 TaxID=1385594 RepID=UPI000AE132B6|nr:hypothetical protein [Burkholderia sp. TSV86]